MTTRLSERERAIRAKMVARYQNKKQLGSAVGTTIGIGSGDKKCNDGDEVVANAENRNTFNVVTTVAAGTPPRQIMDGKYSSSSNSSGGAKSVAAAAAVTTTTATSTMKNNATPPPARTSNELTRVSTIAEKTPTKPKERTSLSDAKRKLAASRMAIASAAMPSAPTTPRGTSTSSIASPRAYTTTCTRSFSTSPRHSTKQQPQQQQQTRLQPQSNAMSLKAQRERFLRIKYQNQSAAETSNNRVDPSMVTGVGSMNHPTQNQANHPTQSEEQKPKLQQYLVARERDTHFSPQIESTTSSITTTTAKQQLRMKIMHQYDDNTEFDDINDEEEDSYNRVNGEKRDGESNTILLSNERCQENPLLQKVLQPPQQQYQKQKEVSPNRTGGLSPLNASYVSSYSSESSGNNLDLHFDGGECNYDDVDDEKDHPHDDIEATVSDPSLMQMPSKQSNWSLAEGHDSSDDAHASDDCNCDNDDLNEHVGESAELAIIESENSVAGSECHLGNVVFESDGFVNEHENISPTVHAAPDLPTNCSRDAGDVFTFKKFENDESMTNDRRVVRNDFDKNPKKSDPSVEKDNDIFEDAWPEDSFSPTAWGTPQAELSFGESSDPWNAHFSQSKSSSDASGPDGWKGSESNAPQHQKTPQARNEGSQIVSAEANNSANSSPNGDVVEYLKNEENIVLRTSSETTTSKDHADEELLHENNCDHKISRDDQKTIQKEQCDSVTMDWKSTTSSTAYVGFGGVLNSCQLSCTESRDDEEEIDVDDVFLLGDSINDDELISRSGSEGTVGTATEFDPLSMFGEELESEDVFSEEPACIKDSALHPTSTALMGTNDRSYLASSTVTNNVNNPITVDSPTGTESLGSWWQSRHALTQNSDINSAVQEALMKRVVFETSHSTDRHGESVSKAYACFKYNESTLHAVDETDQNNEEDSIFSGLEDQLTTKARGVSPAPRLSPPLTQIDDDVFSGVSGSSRQEFISVQFPRLKEANAMKSLLDGTSTTADSPSIQQPPPCIGIAEHQSKERLSGTQSEKVVATTKPLAELFPSNEGYGVINFQRIDHSPTNASVTSDITSSVIFGSGDFRKSSFMKPLDILETTVEAFDQELLADRSIPDPPTSTLEKIELRESPHETVFVEISNPVRSKEQLTPLHGSDFSNLARGGDNFVHQAPSARASPNDPLSHLKAQLQAKPIRQQDAGTTAAEERSSQTKCIDGRTVSEAVQKAKLAFLSHLACGAFASSSFIFCASDSAKISSPKEKNIIEQDIAFKKVSSQIMNSQIAAKSNSESCGSSMAVSQGSESVCSKESNSNHSNLDAQTMDESYDNRLVTSNDVGNQFNSRSFGTSVDESESTNRGSADGCSVSFEDEHCTNSDSQTSSYEVTSLPSRYTDSRDDTDSRTKSGSYLNSEERSNAYHKLLLYAYTALSVPPPSKVAEKGDEHESDRVIYPPVLSPHDALGRSKEIRSILDRLNNEGVEVLKLCREKNWQPRFLRVTKEIMWFRKTNDVRFCGVDSYPRGLLWVKKSDQDKLHNLSSINKNGQGGLLFSAMKHISLMKDNHPLSRKQKKGKFKDSITLVLHSSLNETKREILFRCLNKDEAFALSSAFQTILDRLGDDNRYNQRSRKGELKVNAATAESLGQHSNPKTPLALSKAFSPKVNLDRWEL